MKTPWCSIMLVWHHVWLRLDCQSPRIAVPRAPASVLLIAHHFWSGSMRGRGPDCRSPRIAVKGHIFGMAGAPTSALLIGPISVWQPAGVSRIVGPPELRSKAIFSRRHGGPHQSAASECGERSQRRHSSPPRQIVVCVLRTSG